MSSLSFDKFPQRCNLRGPKILPLNVNIRNGKVLSLLDPLFWDKLSRVLLRSLEDPRRLEYLLAKFNPITRVVQKLFSSSDSLLTTQ